MMIAAETVILLVTQGLSQSQIARRLGVKERTVQRIWSRARKTGLVKPDLEATVVNIERNAPISLKKAVCIVIPEKRGYDPRETDGQHLPRCKRHLRMPS